MQKVILTTGGTAGHIFPALALAEEIKKNYPKCELLFIGGKNGQESRLCQKADLNFVGLNVEGFLGRGWRAIPAMVKMLLAIFQASKILKAEKADIVVGFGGYGAFASLLAAKLIGIPSVLHEQNATPGMANKILAKTVNKICLSLEDRTKVFPSSKSLVTGNPVRREFLELGKIKTANPRPRLLVMGGSQGAKAINSAVIGSIAHFAEAGIEIEHQTGKADYQRVKEAYEQAGLASDLVQAFIEDTPASMGRADLLLCRSGASTVAEITVAAKPAIFIPFPYATNDHQTANAALLAEKGAAILIAENKLKEINFSSLVINLIKDKDTLAIMSSLALSLAKQNAAGNVLQVIEEVLRKKNA